MNKTLLKIASKHKITINRIYPLHGGGINQVFLLACKEGNYIIKINDASRYPKMFEAEAKGLELLRSSNSFKIPKVIFIGTVDNISYLTLQYFHEEKNT